MEKTDETSIVSEISGQVSPVDIEYFEQVSGKHWTGDCAVFSFSSGTLLSHNNGNRRIVDDSFHLKFFRKSNSITA